VYEFQKERELLHRSCVREDISFGPT
jgi:hypothetical protein